MIVDAGPDLQGYLNRIAAKYDLDPEQFLDLFAAQEHRCAICRRQLTLFADDLAEAPVVDHDHRLGHVRGILCRGCNTAIGFIEKNHMRTRRGLAYLKKHGKKPGETWTEAREAGRGWAKQQRKAFGVAIIEEEFDTVLDAGQPAP